MFTTLQCNSKQLRNTGTDYIFTFEANVSIKFYRNLIRFYLSKSVKSGTSLYKIDKKTKFKLHEFGINKNAKPFIKLLKKCLDKKILKSDNFIIYFT